MKQGKTKVDIIAEVLGERNSDIQRLVALDDKVILLYQNKKVVIFDLSH